MDSGRHGRHATVTGDSSFASNGPDGTHDTAGQASGRFRLGEIICTKQQEGAFHAPIRKLPPDTHLYSWGDVGDWLYLIKSGWVKCMTWSWGGKPCLLSISGPTAILGVSSLVTGRRAETAMTKTTTEITIIARDQFQQITCDPALHHAWHKYLTTYIVEQQEALTSFVTLDSEHRLAMTLLKLGRTVGNRVGTRLCISCRITHDELAQMVGTTRSRIGYFLKLFEAQHIVARGGHALVVNEDRLTGYLLAQG